MSDATLPKLRGIAIRNYRSFGNDYEAIAPLERVNLVAGRNNSGKSNVLRFLSKYFNSSPPPTEALDLPVGRSGVSPGFAICIRASDNALRECFDETTWHSMQFRSHGPNPFDTFRRVRDLQGFQITRQPQTSVRTVWIPYELGSNRLSSNPRSQAWGIDEAFIRSLVEELESAGQVSRQALNQLAHNLNNGSTGNPAANIRIIVDKLLPSTIFPPIESVDPFRQIRDDQTGFNVDTFDSWSFDGLNLKRRLQELERPVYEKKEDAQKFLAIMDFVRTVLDDPGAQIQVPNDAQTLHVLLDGLELPIENLGTGIHQVVMLATAAVICENSLICLEEPEIHLHPVLQRKLVKFLAEQTSNKYFIATHSAHILDLDLASVTHAARAGETTHLRPAKAPSELSTICRDLGYRASDILQANCVIWVEGPSDRVYLQHWLSYLVPEYVEGLHYSIMFYGGRLINHLNATDEEFKEFISLRRLNRRSALVADSDKSSRNARWSKTVKALDDEFRSDDTPGFMWVTAGRTIENYVPSSILHSAFSRIHSKSKNHIQNPGRYDDAFESDRRSEPDKVGIAREVCAEWSADQFDTLDLKRRLRTLEVFVRESNEDK